MRRYLTDVLMVFSRLLTKACQPRSRVAQRLAVQDSVRVASSLAAAFLKRLQDILIRSIPIRTDPLEGSAEFVNTLRVRIVVSLPRRGEF